MGDLRRLGFALFTLKVAAAPACVKGMRRSGFGKALPAARDSGRAEKKEEA